MKLPQPVMQCMTLLENAGFACYCVGGCVRDWLLGLAPHDYDLCTAATPDQIKAIFADRQLVLAGAKHGTVGVVADGGVIEITTFRTESGYQDNRHPDHVEFVTDIAADLARRDFTVNAMAWSQKQGLVDPFGGKADLENKVLRAVGHPAARFREDSLRILRGVRFAVRFQLRPEPETMDAMVELAPLMDNLARERIFNELSQLLIMVSARDLATYAPILTQVIPELAPCLGFEQHSRHHQYDIYIHSAHVTENVPAKPALRWAALLHDVGKPDTFTIDEAGNGHFYGHAAISAQLSETILRRLKAPNELREQVVTLVAQHMTYPDPDKKQLRRRLSKLGEATLSDLLLLQEADTGGKGICKEPELAYFPAVRALLAEIKEENSCLSLKDLAVDGHDLMDLGYSGKALGQALNQLLEQVLDEKLPNEKQALLSSLNKQ